MPSLIARCIADDGAAWRELFGEHRSRVLRVLARTVGTQGASSLPDLEQEVWGRLLANDRDALRGLVDAAPASIAAFLSRTALNVGRDHLRRLGVRRVVQSGDLEVLAGQHEDPAESQEAAYLRLERLQAIFDAVDRVVTPPNEERDRLIFRAHYQDGFSASEIAAMGVGLAPKGVETLLLRLVNRVRALLRTDEEDAA